MPSLKDLATNLSTFKYYSGYGTFKQNDLPFGNDRPGNGSSNQPFVVRRIDQRWSPSNFDDGFTRFGVVTLATRTLADLGRISKFLYTTVKGPLFLLKQTGLQRMNPEMLGQSSLIPSGIDGGLLNINTLSTRIYNPLGTNTLAEVGLVGLGGHLTKHGLLPLPSISNAYEKYILRRDSDGLDRLSILTKDLSLSPDRNYVLNYSGGPGSFFGIGRTNIPRASYILNKGVSSGYTPYGTLAPDFSLNSGKVSGFIAIPVSNLRTITSGSYKTILVDYNESDNRGEPPNQYKLSGFQDFRVYKNRLLKKYGGDGNTLATTDYVEQNIEKRIGVARVRPANDRVEYWNSGSDTQDRVNAISLYYSSAPVVQGTNLTDINDNPVNASNIRDIAKFRIKSLDNDNPTYGVYMIFRAYINSLKRSAVANWESYKYVGRGETFKAYDSFSETISIGFTIAASSRQEMKPLYQKINYLISTMAPDYKNSKARGNIAELTIGDFLLYQPGIITSLDVSVDEDTNWEIAINEPENGPDVEMHELPQILRCNMTFIPIYDFLPRKSSEAPFFGIDGLKESKEPKQWLRNTQAKLAKEYKIPTQ